MDYPYLTVVRMGRMLKEKQKELDYQVEKMRAFCDDLVLSKGKMSYQYYGSFKGMLRDMADLSSCIRCIESDVDRRKAARNE